MADTQGQIDLLIKARYPIIYVVTWEEERARELLVGVAKAQKLDLVEWTITDGFRSIEGHHGGAFEHGETMKDPMGALEGIVLDSTRGIFIMKDLHRYFDPQSNYKSREELVRKLRDMYGQLKRNHKTIVITAPGLQLPTELEKSIYIVTLPPPGKDELMDLLISIAKKAKESDRWNVDLSRRDGEKLVDAVLGLTLEEAERVFVKALVEDGTLSSDDIAAVREEKEQIVRKSGLLEYCHVSDNIAGVGGLKLLKRWLQQRGKAFGQKAREYGLPMPKGILLLGVQGCGKSLCAKAISSLWGFPLLRLDLSRVFSGLVGASEDNMRKALQTAESISPVVLWVDEIEKAFSGVESSGRSDAGTTSRVFGTFLTWLQENKSDVFVVATANSIESLPPELLRKGRFDEIFFVDLPRESERKDILGIHFKKRNRDPGKFDIDALCDHCEGFSGAEIEQAIVSSMYTAFDKDRDIVQDDVAAAFQATVPLSVTRRESIGALRKWAKTRARPTS